MMAALPEATRVFSDRCYDNEGLAELVHLLRTRDTCVLDVGAGAGANAKRLRALGKDVYAVTASQGELERLRHVTRSVKLLDIEREVPDFECGSFDAIVCSHILEHLRDPGAVLIRLSDLLKPDGRIYIALPNIAFYKQRLDALRGRFHYSDGGLLDETHLRFYTFWTARRLLERSGFRVVYHGAVGWVPLGPLRRLLGRSTSVDRLGTRWFPNLFGWHILLVGEKDAC